MDIIINEIEGFIRSSKCQAKRISNEDEEDVWLNIINKFTKHPNNYIQENSWIWEDLVDEVSVCNSEAWCWISEFISNSECYFVVNHCGNKCVYIFESGYSLVNMYDATYQNIEFYVTDMEYTYLLAFNHEDYLCACGRAKDWLIDFIYKNNYEQAQFTYIILVLINPDGNYVAYSYDNACRVTKVTTPFGSTSYEYDLLDRLTRVVDRNGYATVYEYDANGNRTAVHYANGFTTTYDYDLLNRLVKQETVDIDGNVVVQYIYTLGAAGERKSVTELDRTVEYTYDSLYRLTSETITEGEKVTAYTYAYDNVSNRILKTENGQMQK